MKDWLDGSIAKDYYQGIFESDARFQGFVLCADGTVLSTIPPRSVIPVLLVPMCLPPWIRNHWVRWLLLSDILK